MYTEDHGESTDAFAITDLWKPSAFTVGPEDPATRSLNQFGLGGIDLNLLNEVPDYKKELRLPDLDAFNFGPLDDISAPESITTSADLEVLQVQELEQDDIWASVEREDELLERKPVRRTWERFNNCEHKEQPSPYLSETGPLAFAAALKLQYRGEAESEESHAVSVQAGPWLKALFQLGLGLESVFFEYHYGNQKFLPRFDNIILSGLTIESTSSLVDDFARVAGNFRSLRSFVDRSYSSKRSSPTHAAVAETNASILMLLNDYIVDSFPQVQSALQLQAVFQRPARIVDYLARLVKVIASAKSEEDILSEVYIFAQQSEFGDRWAQPLMLEILARTSVPWLGALSASLGLRSTALVNQDNVQLLHQHAENYVNGDPDASPIKVMPGFFTPQEQDGILLTCSSLKLLRTHHEGHILVNNVETRSMQTPNLEWHFGWSDIERVQKKAIQYEAQIKMAITPKANPGVSFTRKESEDANDLWSPYGMSDTQLKQNFIKTSSTLEQLPAKSEVYHTSNPLFQTLQNCLVSEESQGGEPTFAPPLSLTPLLSFSPIIATQAKLVNHACLQMLFKQHDLRSHLALQRRFHLLGDGVFATRLSEALFDPSLDSAERQKGRARAGTMGLRLGSRETWPPASSELRLALQGVLTDSYNTSASETPGSLISRELPGGLSFAIRNISEEEIQKCLDPYSLEALDFLRLQYKPPPPIDAIITLLSLDKYDRIFKLLLRMTRLLFVTAQLSRHGLQRRGTRTSIVFTRFRIESTHFIHAVCDYFFNVGVGGTWERFEHTLSDLTARLDDPDVFDRFGENEGLHHLRLRHDKMLDSMLFALLLRNRQNAVMKLLEEIFGLVLLFVKDVLGEGTLKPEGEMKDSPSVEELYACFKTKTRIFVTVCRGLSEQRAYGAAKEAVATDLGGVFGRAPAQEENTIEQLLLKLEMNGWYA